MIGNIDFVGGIQTLINETDGAATTYYSPHFNSGGGVSGNAVLTVFAVIGTTPDLNVTIEGSGDGVNWETIATFTEASGATSEVESLSAIYRYTRAKMVVDGSDAGVSFSLTGVIRAG